MPKILQPCFPGGGLGGLLTPRPRCRLSVPVPGTKLAHRGSRDQDGDRAGEEEYRRTCKLRSIARRRRCSIRYCTYIEGGNRSEANGVVFSISTKVQTAPSPPRWVRGEHLLVSPVMGGCGIIVPGQGGTRRRKEKMRYHSLPVCGWTAAADAKRKAS